MKTLNSFLPALVLIVVFSSCTSNENLIEDESSVDLLKSYTVKRDKSGAYSLDYKLIDGATSDNIKNSETNVNEIYLYSSGVVSKNNSKNSYSESLQIKNDHLAVGFIDTNSDKRRSQITIIDDNIILARGEEEEFLNEYSVTSNGDSTYDLNFSVKENVSVNFVYNEEENKYEIHLTSGSTSRSGSTSSFSNTFTKESGTNLEIAFVISHEAELAKKPVVIIK